jgi:hypothetical protein
MQVSRSPQEVLKMGLISPEKDAKDPYFLALP